MDLARKYLPSRDLDEAASRTRTKDLPSGIDGLEKVLRFSAPSRESETIRGERLPGPSAREVGQAMELVHQAAQSIRAAEERALDGEARTQALLKRATEELKSAEERVQAAEGRTRAAEARIADAEARATEAENWLRQIFSTISEELPSPR